MASSPFEFFRNLIRSKTVMAVMAIVCMVRLRPLLRIDRRRLF